MEGRMSYAVKEIFYTLQGEGGKPDGPLFFVVLPDAISGRGWSATAQPPNAAFAIRILLARMVKTAANSPMLKLWQCHCSTMAGSRARRRCAGCVHRWRAVSATERHPT